MYLFAEVNHVGRAKFIRSPWKLTHVVAVSEARGCLPELLRNDAEAEEGIGKYLTFYNQKRSHQALNHRTPDQVYQAEQQDQAA